MNLNLHQIKNKPTNLIETDIGTALWRLSWPAMIGMLFQSLSGITDVFFLGRVQSPDAQAAIGIFGVLMGYLASFNSIIGNGSISVIAQFYGSNRLEEAGNAATQTLSLKLFGSLLFCIPVIFVLKPLLILFGATGGALESGIIYGRILCLAIPLMNTGYSFNTALRAAGDAVTPMFLMLITLLLNLVFNTCFILGVYPFPKMGIAGVALATLFSQVCLFLMGLYVYTRPTSKIRIRLKDLFRPDFPIMKKIFQIGLPTGFQGLIGSFAGSIIMRVIAGYGMTVVAAYTIATKVASFASMPVSGLSFATSAIVGQNVGAQKGYRAMETTKLAAKIALIITTSFFILYTLFPRFFLDWFSHDVLIQNSSIPILIIFSFIQIIGSLASILGAPLLGTGYLKVGFYLSLFVTWVIHIPSLWLFGRIWGLTGIWISFLLTNLVNLYYIYGIFIKKKWLQNVI
ncbi:MATE family efflux transporter [bacterium]|nr:MATE family efflux transporter [bacterium]